MIKLKDILNEQEAKKLRVFDMDDTLITSHSRVIVNHADGTTSYLKPGEYAVYVKKEGDEMDYSEFSKLVNPREIKAMTKVLRVFYNAGGGRRLTILTARGHEKPLREFLDEIGIKNIEIVALGDSNPQKKADWIEDRIKDGYNNIFFADDSYKNIEAVSKLKEKYPNLKWEIRLAKYR